MERAKRERTRFKCTNYKNLQGRFFLYLSIIKLNGSEASKMPLRHPCGCLKHCFDVFVTKTGVNGKSQRSSDTEINMGPCTDG